MSQAVLHFTEKRESEARNGAEDQLIVPFVLLLAASALVLLAPLPVAALGAILFVAVASRAPVPALCLLVVSLPFLLPRHIGREEFTPTELAIVLCTMAGLLRVASLVWRTQLKIGWRNAVDRAYHLARERSGDPTVTILVLLVVVAAAISLTVSVELRESLRSFRTIIVEPIAFYFLAVLQARRRRDAYLLACALVVAGVLISLVGLWQYATDERIITAEAGLRRIRGFYGSPNNLGLFLGRAVPMAVGLALWWKRGRTLLVAAALLMTVAVILTFSFGAWLAIPSALVAIAALRGKAVLRVTIAIGSVGLVLLAIAAIKIPRIGSHFDLRWGTSFARIELWKSSLRMIATSPIRGIGLDNFLYYYQHGYRLPGAWQELDLSHPHNIILDFWLSLGLPGLILLGCLGARFVELMVAQWERSTATERGVYAGVVGAMVDTLVHGLVDNSFFLPDLAVLFWLMFAIVGVLQNARDRRAS